VRLLRGRPRVVRSTEERYSAQRINGKIAQEKGIGPFFQDVFSDADSGDDDLRSRFSRGKKEDSGAGLSTTAPASQRGGDRRCLLYLEARFGVPFFAARTPKEGGGFQDLALVGDLREADIPAAGLVPVSNPATGRCAPPREEGINPSIPLAKLSGKEERSGQENIKVLQGDEPLSSIFSKKRP